MLSSLSIRFAAGSRLSVASDSRAGVATHRGSAAWSDSIQSGLASWLRLSRASYHGATKGAGTETMKHSIGASVVILAVALSPRASASFDAQDRPGELRPLDPP